MPARTHLTMLCYQRDQMSLETIESYTATVDRPADLLVVRVGGGVWPTVDARFGSNEIWDDNPGIGGALNRIWFRHGMDRYEYLGIVGNDAGLCGAWLSRLEDLLDECPRVGWVAAQIARPADAPKAERAVFGEADVSEIDNVQVVRRGRVGNLVALLRREAVWKLGRMGQESCMGDLWKYEERFHKELKLEVVYHPTVVCLHRGEGEAYRKQYPDYAKWADGARWNAPTAAVK